MVANLNPTREEVRAFHDRQRDRYLTEETRMKLYKKEGRRYIQITRAEIVAEGLDILRSSPRVKGYVKDVEIAMLMGHVVITEPETLGAGPITDGSVTAS